MSLVIARAREADAAAVAAMRNAAAAELTRGFGFGHWSSTATERGVLRAIASSTLLVARCGRDVVGTLRLATKKPWAIAPEYFTKVARPLYLIDMAVHPDAQRRGVGRALLEEASAVARAWPAQAIRLDAYDAPAGAGGFYEKCGYQERGRVVYRSVPLIYYEQVLRPR